MKTLKTLSTKKKIYRHFASELSIQNRFIGKLRVKHPNAFIVKLSDNKVSGLPDIMKIEDGLAEFFEVKTQNGVVTKIQEATHKALRHAGALVTIVRG